MARNWEPVDSQSESGEDEGSSEEVDSDSETQKKSQPQMAAKSAPSSSEELDSGSEFESDDDSNPIEETQRPINGARKAIFNPSATAAKRPAEDTAAAKDAKKSKNFAEQEVTSEKRSNLFQRLWSEDDEIVILRGMIDYASQNKSYPILDLNAFHNFIQTSLHIDVTRAQLQDKIRRLKKKYENNKSKEKEGKERTFSKPHEQTAYDLSKLIWGINENGSAKANGSVARKRASKKVNAEEVKDVKNAVAVSGQGETKRLNSTSVGATTEERMLVAGREYFESGQGLYRQRDWQKLRVEELQLYAKQLEVRLAQTKLVLEVMIGKDQ